MERSTGKIVAVKVIDIFEEKVLNQINQEIQSEIKLRREGEDMSRFRNNVVNIFNSFIYSKKLFITFEYFEHGSLHDLMTRSEKIRAKKGIDSDILAVLLRAMLLSLKSLHDKGKVVKSIKSSNIFVTLEGSIKILDYSFGKILNESTEKSKTYLNGSPLYLAPEVIRDGDFHNKGDVWALGILALELSEGKPPFEYPNSPSTIFEIVHRQSPEPKSSASAEFKSFVAACLDKNVEKRLSVDELLVLPFIANCKHVNVLKEYLSYINEKIKAIIPQSIDLGHPSSKNTGSTLFTIESKFTRPEQLRSAVEKN